LDSRRAMWPEEEGPGLVLKFPENGIFFVHKCPRTSAVVEPSH
jgi:hypothetical protein